MNAALFHGPSSSGGHSFSSSDRQDPSFISGLWSEDKFNHFSVQKNLTFKSSVCNEISNFSRSN